MTIRPMTSSSISTPPAGPAAVAQAALLDSAGFAEDPRLARLLSLYAPAYQLAVRSLGFARDAEDVVQQAYIKALNHLPAELPEGEVQPWFFRVVVNAARDHQRTEIRRHAREAASGGNILATSEAPPPDGVTREMLADLQICLNALEERYRLPLVLCYEQGLSQNAAAQVLDMPARTLSKYLEDGLELLRKKMTERGHTAAPALLMAALPYGAVPVPIDLEPIAREILRRAPRTPVAPPDPLTPLPADPTAPPVVKPPVHIGWKILIGVLIAIAVFFVLLVVGFLVLLMPASAEANGGASSSVQVTPGSVLMQSERPVATAPQSTESPVAGLANTVAEPSLAPATAP